MCDFVRENLKGVGMGGCRRGLVYGIYRSIGTVERASLGREVVLVEIKSNNFRRPVPHTHTLSLSLTVYKHTSPIHFEI